MKNTLCISFLLGMLASLASCNQENSTESGANGLTFPLSEVGPFNTGYQTWEITYRPTPDAEERTIPIHVWYPTTAEHDYQSDPPTENPTYAGLYSDVDTITNAPPASPVYPSGFPVLAYSHGHQGIAGGSYRLMSYFASHGWMALAVGHVGNRLIDGTEATNRPVTHWHRRPLDISAALDAIEALNPDHPLSGKADTSVVLSTGHSRGTYTPWALAGSTYDLEEIQKRCDEHKYRDECTSQQIQRFSEGFKDSRIAAILPTAGDGHSEFFDGVEGRNNLATAVLLMTAKENPVGAEALFERLHLPNFTWVEIAGGCHELFNLGCGFVEDSEKFPLVTTYALAFGRRYILNDSDPTTLGILDGSIEVSPHITIKKN